MTTNGAVERVNTNAAPVPGFVGQATAIEQSRAVAEVQAAIVVAQQCPRDMRTAVGEMEQSCRQPGLAQRAFFSYPRGGQTVTGASVHLARELARCFGNIQYGIAELRRDDEAGLSEMQAYAWDVQTNTRSTQIFVVPHRRDRKDKRSGKNVSDPLLDLRDIYENNANMGARRLRAAIFSILPAWFTDQAEQICHDTMSGKSGEDLAASIEKAVTAFGRRGVSVKQLEEKIGRPRAGWTGEDFAQLDILFASIKRGELSLDEAFQPERVTADEITGGAPPLPAATADDSWPEAAQPGGGR
jgi:hypothetical protein